MKTYNWSDIYEKESGKLLAILRRYLTDIETAEDILHESFIKAMQSSSTFKEIGSIEGWLKQIAINTALDHIRKNKNNWFVDVDNVQIAEETESEIDTTNFKNEILNSTFSKEELLGVIDLLPNHHKTIFNLYVIDGYSHKQIATKLNITETYSKTTLSRSRKKVQNLLHERVIRDKAKLRKRVAGVTLFSTAFAGESFADNIFRKSFKLDSLSAKNISPDLLKGFQQANPITIKLTLQIVKITSIVFAGSGIAASITFAVSNIKSTHLEIKPLQEKTINREIISTQKTIDTIIVKKENTPSIRKEIEPTNNGVITTSPQLIAIDSLNSESVQKDSLNTNSVSTLTDTTTSASNTKRNKVVVKRKVYIKQ